MKQSRINLLKIVLYAGVYLVLNSGISELSAQVSFVRLSGRVIESESDSAIPFTNLQLLLEADSSFIQGTISDENGRFVLNDVKPSSYLLKLSSIGYQSKTYPLFVGSLSKDLDLSDFKLENQIKTLNEFEISATQDDVSGKMDKKSFNLEENISQSGGSVLQALQNLPGITVQDGKVAIRGNDKIIVMMDGKQTALTGMGSQSGLDNIPASSIERIEVINNPSAKYDANGNAGIINIIYKKNNEDGFHGKYGLAGGLGALFIKNESLPGIRPQYQNTTKFNPSLSLNYKRKKLNLFINSDYLYTESLNKNEFTDRYYDDGTVIRQQVKRNRLTSFLNLNTGIDYKINEKNAFLFSGAFGSEKILDRGDQPFYNANLSERLRLWEFLEDELKTTVNASAQFTHDFKTPGEQLIIRFDYTFHREDEKYFFTNNYPTYTGKDSFKLISDERVFDFETNYSRPLKHGKFESGVKFRRRTIPTNMLFLPGLNSPLDTSAGGAATYKETIPAIFANYFFENKFFEAEIGLRAEYVSLNYEVNPNHNTYKSDGYSYFQPFPNVRLTKKFKNQSKVSLFFNRRVDRPNEVDIIIFPKYDDAEIIKVGNPGLNPQFTNSFELGYKLPLEKGYFYSALYQKNSQGTITRISTIATGSNIIYNVFQNAGNSSKTGAELIYNFSFTSHYSWNLNVNAYYSVIDAFSIANLYPVESLFSAKRQSIYSGNIKLNQQIKLKNNLDVQISTYYMAPDIIPQGKTNGRFSLDIGIKKNFKKSEIFLNATDLLNTMVIKKEIIANGFRYTSADYLETQVIRVGYKYKF